MRIAVYAVVPYKKVGTIRVPDIAARWPYSHEDRAWTLYPDGRKHPHRYVRVIEHGDHDDYGSDTKVCVSVHGKREHVKAVLKGITDSVWTQAQLAAASTEDAQYAKARLGAGLAIPRKFSDDDLDGECVRSKVSDLPLKKTGGE
jgi:hypothetical protein